MPQKRPIWKHTPEEHDFPAAKRYLSLIRSSQAAHELSERLARNTEITHYKAKDLLRASRLPLLTPEESYYVRSDLKKVKRGLALSPVLLVRADPLIIADGYHRMCASYSVSEDEDIPCSIVDEVTGRAPARAPRPTK